MEPSSATASAQADAKIKMRMHYALEHFKYLADQRMKTFNYYAIVVAASITGSITALDRCSWQVVVAMGAVQFVIAWIFFVIDIRNSRLVFCARRALVEVEKDAGFKPPLCVIRCDESGDEDVATDRDQLREEWGKGHGIRKQVNRLCPGGASFTMAFNAAFALQICSGIGLIFAALWLKGPFASSAH